MRDPNLFIGIDPGNSGGICATTGRISICDKTPGTVADMAKLMLSVLDMGTRPMVVIESVHSMPGNSGRSMFTFGTNYGQWLGILASLHIPYIQVPPTTWMRTFGAMPKARTARKNHLKHLAQQRYPDLHITLATADAVLIAHYCFTKYKLNN